MHSAKYRARPAVAAVAWPWCLTAQEKVCGYPGKICVSRGCVDKGTQVATSSGRLRPTIIRGGRQHGTITWGNLGSFTEGGSVAHKQDPDLVALVGAHLVGVTVHQQIGYFETPAEDINVLIVEGDQNRGVGVVMSEPMIIDPDPPVFCGDLVEWVPGPGKIGRITKIAVPDFEVL